MELTSDQKVCIDCQACCKYLAFRMVVKDPVKYRRLIAFHLAWGNKVFEFKDGKTLEIVMPYQCRFCGAGAA